MSDKKERRGKRERERGGRGERKKQEREREKLEREPGDSHTEAVGWKEPNAGAN